MYIIDNGTFFCFQFFFSNFFFKFFSQIFFSSLDNNYKKTTSSFKSFNYHQNHAHWL